MSAPITLQSVMAAYRMGGASAVNQLGIELPDDNVLAQLITQAVGEASMCWSTIRTHGAGVFLAEVALDVAMRLRVAVVEEFVKAEIMRAHPPWKAACVIRARPSHPHQCCAYGIQWCSVLHVA